jgi:hypothetical protein
VEIARLLKALTESGALAPLRQQHPGVDDTWWLLNGRRTAGGICQRSPRPAAATLAYLEILLEESQIGPRRPP